MKIEIEKKYYCKNEEKLVMLLEKKGLKKISSELEKDEYFTDIDSEYIKNRTCLRLRETDDSLTLTFKGKSMEFGNAYAKVENDITLKKDEYNNIHKILSSLEFCSYTIVNKQRLTYTKREKDYVFNVMIDVVDEIGGFVEFELLCYQESYDLNLLKKKLDSFIRQFNEIEFEEASLPYRDFMAQALYNKIISNSIPTALLIDFDGTLVDTEKTFFNSFKKVLQDKYNVEINYYDYKKNELEKNAELINSLKRSGRIDKTEPLNTIMDYVYKEYKKQLSLAITSNEEILNFKLLKRLKQKGMKLGLVSTSKKEYIDIILNKLNSNDLFDVIIARENVDKLKPEPDAYFNAMKLLELNENECIALEDSKRGIKSAIEAGIKTIQVDGFTKDNENYYSVPRIDKISRLILILINNL